jgi:hypothetical protein
MADKCPRTAKFPKECRLLLGRYAAAAPLDIFAARKRCMSAQAIH